MPDSKNKSQKHTPVYKTGIPAIWVKREDKCFENPAPPFSKCRGIILHLSKLKSSGVNIVGYTETSISMAGWGVAWACSLLDMTAVIFDPQYKETLPTLAYHRAQWAKFPNAVIRNIPAGMAKVNFYISKKMLSEEFGPKAVMLPLGLPFPETVVATAEEVKYTLRKQLPMVRTIVSCVGSGTVLSGIYKGLDSIGSDINLFGIMTRTGNVKEKIKTIEKKSGVMSCGFFKSSVNLQLIDLGFEYTDKASAEAPFECNPYYDLKAWQWLIDNFKYLEPPILFWNIGK